jgi:thiol-disulfide isomerase/thioredoxin
MIHLLSARLRRAILLCLSTALVTAVATAQMPSDHVLSGFEPTSDYLFVLGGETPAGSEVYFSERAVAYLVMSPALSSPVLLSPRSRSVEKVHLMKVRKTAEGTIDLLADAILEPLGSFEITGQEIAFELAGKPAKLTKKPDLLGEHSGGALLADDVAYRRGAEGYQPAGAALTALRQWSQPATVRVYFGSWCPACKRLVPRLLRVEEALADSPIEFEYYGLPHDLSSDPEADRMDVHGVPTGIVFRGGKEIGRLTQNAWNAPERSLLEILQGS